MPIWIRFLSSCSNTYISALNEPIDILKKYWGYPAFRPLQQEIIDSVLAKKDTLALLPTGGGKSICYQVPALVQEGLCLVVSPLIALMKDQVENLRQRGIMALAIYSGMSRRQIAQTLKNAAYGDYKLLYVSPERLETDLFKEFLPALGVNLIAVDEAHCISQWGYDFRPSYLKIAELRKELPEVPLLALTASATREVQEDIFEKLLFPTQTIFRQSYERKNLSYSLFAPESKSAKLVDIVKNVRGASIVYCKSRKQTAEIARLLQLHGFSAQHYHAGLESNERNKRQQDWIENNTSIMVCTNAFGMGIDKADVRLVVHMDAPDSLENYYQEAGRAGRDGKRSYAVLLQNKTDNANLSQLHKTRFPDFETIKNTYSSLVNFLQIPSYGGEGIAFTFRFDEWVRNFKLNSLEALYSLKALESDGWLSFNEQSFAPASLQFTTNKTLLYDFYSAYPQHEELLTTLLRTYEGIFDHPVFISEKTIAYLLRQEEVFIKNQLLEINAHRIIDYKPQNDEPQIIFRKQRVPVTDLKIDMRQFEKRKASFIKRVDKMIDYTETTECRASFINEYFGDKTLPCGICDNCLRLKKTELTKEEFKNIQSKIQQVLMQKTLTPEELLTGLNGIPKEKAWQVLNYLQSEKKISTNEQGLFFLS